ncbi:glycosyltransferase family 4 protein [Paracraurococcus lichenis]|uniref:Glycosyltransferase family 4 protein n=1 Tax=Paracraurococcus lichenis TaxID=3064888 RepID=A0ABT9E8E9_9PROT|nr:glycosyltransferase family 4 protein [Paracraurococcus sp. LOR1-02]MDO9712340.1 glycosyltransferase family 4 protein [Paracraurococcus sp. LOR1-02]
MSDARRLRLLMTADAVGGVWTYALDLAGALAPHGVETVLAVMGPRPAPDQRAAAQRVPGLRLLETDLPLEWLAGSAAEVLGSGQALARLAQQTGADLVHLNAPGPAAAAGFPVPVLVACHSCLATWWQAVRGSEMPADFRWRAELTARGYRAADLLVAPSAAFAAATRAAYRLPAAPIVVPNARQPAVASAMDAAQPFAFTAGRLWDEGKDAATLDRAAALLPFPLMAAGPLEGPHGAQAAFAHLRRLGRLSTMEVAAWLAARPIFASAARYEPFGLTVLEAAQAGCALVLADTPVFRELWADAAVFVPPGDAPAFADAIHRLAMDGERRRALGVAAGERARHYGPEAQAQAMLAAYRRLLQGAHHQTGRDAAA